MLGAQTQRGTLDQLSVKVDQQAAWRPPLQLLVATSFTQVYSGHLTKVTTNAKLSTNHLKHVRR